MDKPGGCGIRALLVLIIAGALIAGRTCRAALPAPAAAGPDVGAQRLCAESADPDAAPDKRLIHCELESGAFAPAPADSPSGDIKIAAYNMERGTALDKQILLFQKHPLFRDADILLLSEVDRGCERSGVRNQARDMARALGMNYVYGVEFVELDRDSARAPVRASCEHGNAVLSRWPIVNMEQIRHARAADWYEAAGRIRLGGRTTVAADLDINGRPLRVYSVHFDSGLHDDPLRQAQARELAAHAASVPYPVIIGGDMNTHAFVSGLLNNNVQDPTVPVFLNAGYTDAHAGLKPNQRGTTDKEYGFRMVIDLIFVKGAQILDAGICPAKICDPLSDHLPIWAAIRMNGA